MSSHRASSTTAADDARTDQEHPSEESFRAAHIERGPRREIRAERPRPDEDSLRAAYLGLLKLCLCDLGGASTLSVTRSGDSRADGGPLYSRELVGEELNLRVKGVDWPWSGLTMIGLTRLDDLQRCVESIVADGVEGDLIEAGAWRGGASILMRATLDSLGADERTVWVADSFAGLPPPDAEGFPEDRGLDLSSFDFLAVPVEEVREHFARFGCEHGVRFVQGFFDETLPGLRDRRWSLVRLDGDTYESTWLALQSLYPGLSAGGYLIVDDYLLIDECREAVDDFRRRHRIAEPIEEVDWNGARWRRESEAPLSGAGLHTPPRGVARSSSGRVVEQRERGERSRIPTKRELVLEQELAWHRSRPWPARLARRILKGRR